MILVRLMIKKTFPYSDQVLNYFSISNKLFDVKTVSLVLILSFLYSTLTFSFLGNRPHRLWFTSKKTFETKYQLLSRSTLIFAKNRSTLHRQESEYFKRSTITWDSNDTIKLRYPIRLCSSTGLLRPSEITLSTAIAQTRLENNFLPHTTQQF